MEYYGIAYDFAFLRACSHGNVAKMIELLPQVDQKIIEEGVILAVRNNKDNIISYLVDNKIKFDMKKALDESVIYGRVDVGKILIMTGCNTDSLFKSGYNLNVELIAKINTEKKLKLSMSNMFAYEGDCIFHE